MKAVVRINEGQVIRLRSDQRALVRVTGLREPMLLELARQGLPREAGRQHRKEGYRSW